MEPHPTSQLSKILGFRSPTEIWDGHKLLPSNLGRDTRKSPGKILAASMMVKSTSSEEMVIASDAHILYIYIYIIYIFM